MINKKCINNDKSLLTVFTISSELSESNTLHILNSEVIPAQKQLRSFEMLTTFMYLPF